MNWRRSREQGYQKQIVYGRLSTEVAADGSSWGQRLAGIWSEPKRCTCSSLVACCCFAAQGFLQPIMLCAVGLVTIVISLKTHGVVTSVPGRAQLGCWSGRIPTSGTSNMAGRQTGAALIRAKPLLNREPDLPGKVGKHQEQTTRH